MPHTINDPLFLMCMEWSMPGVFKLHLIILLTEMKVVTEDRQLLTVTIKIITNDCKRKVSLLLCVAYSE